MSSLQTFRSHIPPQFDKHVDKITSRLSPQPPSSQAGAAPSEPPPPEKQQPQTFELAPRGHSMMVTESETGSPLLTITFASSSSDEKAPDLLVLRGDGGGAEIASAQFHRWTSSKTDIHFHDSGATTKIKKNFASTTGLGDKARWEKDGRKAMVLKTTASDGTGGKGKDKEVLARFEAVGKKSNRKKGTGQFDILKAGLAREQLEEIVVSCLVERERMRRDGEFAGGLLQEGVWEIFMASLGMPPGM